MPWHPAEIARESVPHVYEEWDALADRTGATPFLRPGWIEAWWQAFGSGRLQILTARRRGILEAVLPVATRRGAVVAPSNWHTPEFGIVGSDGDSVASLLEGLFERHHRLVSLGFLTLSCPAVEQLGVIAARHRYQVTTRTLQRSPYVEIAGGWSSYERALDGPFRRDLLRRRRRLEELGRLNLDVAYTTDALPTALALERTGWKERSGTAISQRPDTLRFYTRVAAWAAERRSLALIFLRLDGRAIAFHLAIEDNGVYYALKGGFDPEYRSYSPGKLIVHATLERAFNAGLRRYEVLGADDPYKRRWATAVHEHVLVEAFAPTAPGLVSQLAHTQGRRAAKRVLGAAREARRRIDRRPSHVVPSR